MRCRGGGGPSTAAIPTSPHRLPASINEYDSREGQDALLGRLMSEESLERRYVRVMSRSGTDAGLPAERSGYIPWPTASTTDRAR